MLPGGVAALGLAALLNLGALQPLENIAYNALFRLRGKTAWDDRLVLVAIDDASIRQLGRFPWSRRHYTQLLTVLNRAEPSVVALDLLLSEPTPDDAQLARAMADYGRVVLGQAWDTTGLPLVPVPSIRDAALSTGHIHTEPDPDGIVRSILPQIQGEPALGIAAIETYSLVQTLVQKVKMDRPIWLNWVGSPIQQYSFVDVMQGKIPDRALRNKIVLVGVTAAGIEPRLTPFSTNPVTSGVHIQATLINNLLQQNVLYPIQGKWLLIILLVGGPGLSLLISYWRTETQVAIAAGLSLSWIGLSLALLKMTYLMPVVLPLSLVASTALISAIVERLRMNALLQRQIRQMWQAYQPTLVLRPNAPQLLAVSTSPSMRQVTQLAALAEQFGRSQSTQAAIARSLSVGLVAADCNGLVWFCNPVAFELSQIQIGSQLENHLVPEWMSETDWRDHLQALHQPPRVSVQELRRGDRWFSFQLELLRDETILTSDSDRLTGLLLVIEDITTRKQVEANLDQQIHELHHMSQMKDDFLSTVSHELRTPLTNMKMAIQLLKISAAEQQRSHYLKILENECNREAELINDLLDLQRLEAGVEITNSEVIHLQDWLPAVVEPFYKRTEDRQQTLVVKVVDPLPDLLSDQPSLERIVVELVNNACKYTPPTGEITVSATWVSSWIELAVRNSGAEIPEQELTRIFERFYRVPRADPWKQGGTGLGLALVEKLVERLGGRIEVKSGFGSTTFTIALPVSQKD